MIRTKNKKREIMFQVLLEESQRSRHYFGNLPKHNKERL